MTPHPRVCGIHGSLRPGAIHERLLLKILQPLESHFGTFVLEGLENLPLFAEGLEPTVGVLNVQGQLAQAEAFVISTPEYIHSLPAALKNLFEWTVGSMQFYRKPVAVVTAYGHSLHVVPQVCEILRTMDAVVLDSACGPMGLSGRNDPIDGNPMAESRIAEVSQALVTYPFSGLSSG